MVYRRDRGRRCNDFYFLVFKVICYYFYCMLLDIEMNIYIMWGRLDEDVNIKRLVIMSGDEIVRWSRVFRLY